MTRTSPILIAIAGVLATTHASAVDKEACLSSHVESQQLRKKHALRATHAKLLVCAREGCPALVQKDCTRWLAEVEAQQPTIVVVATDEGGKETFAVKVFVDDALVAEKLDGSPIEIDPGEHVLRFERASGKREERVVIRESEKARRIEVQFGTKSVAKSAPAPEPERVSKGIPTATWIFGGLGVVALGSWGYFGLAGRARESSLASSCAPSCSDGDVAGLKRRYLVADVSLGVGIVSLGLATYFAIASSRDERRVARWVDVATTSGGGVVTFGAIF